MLDKQGNILYVGKSIALKKRISSYLAKEVKRNNKIKQMLSHLYDVEVYYTDTELDALLLECKWIQYYKPSYNTALMHPQKYGYLVLEGEPHYEIKWCRVKPSRALRIIGPLTHPRLSRQAEEFYRVQYPFMCCKVETDRCMKTAFGKCEGYCKAEDRAKRVAFFDESLKEDHHLQERVMKQIELYSANWEFEKAGACYEQLKGLNYIRSMQHMLNKLQVQQMIGRMPIPHTHLYKYYLIRQGRIQKTMKGPLSEEAEIIEILRRLAKEEKLQEEVAFLKENIDEIKIIYSFSERKMYRIEV